MLKVSRSPYLEVAEAAQHVAQQPAHLRPSSALGNLRKHSGASTVLVLIFVSLGLGYALTSTPLYTASTDILIDARRSHASEPGASNRSLAELGMDPASIDSQVAVLGSEQVAIDTLKQLHLDRDREFATPTTLPALLIDTVKHALGHGHQDESKDGVPADVLEGFMQRLTVKRMPSTYVLSLSFAAQSPDRAAAIVNSIANVYANRQIEAAIEARRMSAAWLKTRIAGVRDEIAAAEQAVRSYKAESKDALIASSPGSNAIAGPTPNAERLRDLEHDLDDKRLLYAALIGQANAALELQSMPVSDASVIKAARPPRRKSQPNMLLILLLSGIAGLAAALGLATWREIADKTFRVPSQIEADLGVRFLGVLPRMAMPRTKRGELPRADWTWSEERCAASPLFLRQHTQSESRTRFAGTLRAVKLAADDSTFHDKPAVIGITSALAGEGRSTVAANLGAVIARSGHRTLVIDADLRNPKLSQICAPRRQAGLVDLMARTARLNDVITRDEQAGIDVLPACGSDIAGTGVTLGLAELKGLLDAVSDRYDVVVLDLPPLAALTEVTALAPAVGAFVLVVAWGRTERAVVAEALQATPSVADRLVGALLNDVDSASLGSLARHPKDVFYLTGTHRPRSKPVV